MTETTEDVKAGFAGLMSKAAEAARPPEGDAPYGYKADGTPKRAAGRPRRQSPSIEELKAEAEATAPEVAAEHVDRAPSSRRPHRRTRREPGEPKAPVVQFREGVIERGINKLYRRAGKMVKVWDEPTGLALIEITRKDDPEDTTVGEAWENLARRNPRIRAFLMRIISGGDWGRLVMCHAPVGMALFLKFRLGERLPMGKVAEAFLTPDDEDGAPADGSPLAGLQPADMDQMMAMARQFAERAMNGPRVPEGPAAGPPVPGV